VLTIAAAAGVLLISPGTTKLAALLKDDEISSFVVSDKIDGRCDAFSYVNAA